MTSSRDPEWSFSRWLTMTQSIFPGSVYSLMPRNISSENPPLTVSTREIFSSMIR